MVGIFHGYVSHNQRVTIYPDTPRSLLRKEEPKRESPLYGSFGRQVAASPLMTFSWWQVREGTCREGHGFCMKLYMHMYRI